MDKKELVERLEANYKKLFDEKEKDYYSGNQYYVNCKRDIKIFIQALKVSDITVKQCKDCVEAYAAIFRDRNTRIFDDRQISDSVDEPEFKNEKDEMIWLLTECKNAYSGMRDVVAGFGFALGLNELFQINDKKVNYKELFEKLGAGEIEIKEDSNDPDDEWIRDLCCTVRTAKLLRDLIGEELVPEVTEALVSINA